MINHSAMETFVAERQATMLSEADHRRLMRRGSPRRAIRPVAVVRSRWTAARAASTPTETLAPASTGGLRSFLHLSRA
jgi:hypothetical protein